MGTARSSAGLDDRRRRLLFRSWHRGTQEMDLIMGRFADAHLADLSDADLNAYEHIIELHDTDLFPWITGEAAMPAEHDTPVMRMMRAFHFRTRESV